MIQTTDSEASRKRSEREAALNELRELLPPSTTVYTVLKHVSRSGMLRHIDAFVMRDGEPFKLNWLIEKAGIGKRAAHYDAKNADSLRVGGCGMDMGFALVYALSSRLYPKGYRCTGDNCKNNEHVNGDNKRRKGGPKHSDGGYALIQRWF